MISLFDIIYSGILISFFLSKWSFVEMYTLLSPKSPPFLYPYRNLNNYAFVKCYTIFPFLNMFSILSLRQNLELVVYLVETLLTGIV